MRFNTLLILPLIGASALAPQRATAQVNVSIHLGTPLYVSNYDQAAYGDWHRSYTQWRPVTVYVYDGHYYSSSVRGARPVVIYRRGSDYFLPPRDVAWANHGDKRYNYKRRPTDDDYSHASPPKNNGNGRGRGRGRGGI